MTFLTLLGNMLFPRECVQCGSSGTWLCAPCLAQIPLAIPTCPVCRASTIGGRTHEPCAHTFALQGCLAAASLSLPPVERLIYGCKYHGLRSAAAALAALMARAEAHAPLLTGFIRNCCPVLCPVPLHPQRERERGFNQAALLARALSEAFRLPVRSLLARTTMTRDQVKLTREQRRQNLAGAFAISDEGRELPAGVVLIDDVVTSGATFDAAARALKNARKDIAVWGLAAAYHAAADATPLHT